MSAPVLVFGWGNPSRGDDALGPQCIEQLQELAAQHPEWGAVDFLMDFQLQVEHALDLAGREAVLFVDADVGLTEPCRLTRIEAQRDGSLGSHQLSPQAVLQVFAELHAEAPPPCSLLRLRGTDFGLGNPLSAVAQTSLDAGMRRAAAWIEHACAVTPT